MTCCANVKNVGRRIGRRSEPGKKGRREEREKGRQGDGETGEREADLSPYLPFSLFPLPPLLASQSPLTEAKSCSSGKSPCHRKTPEIPVKSACFTDGSASLIAVRKINCASVCEIPRKRLTECVAPHSLVPAFQSKEEYAPPAQDHFIPGFPIAQRCCRHGLVIVARSHGLLR